MVVVYCSTARSSAQGARAWGLGYGVLCTVVQLGPQLGPGD